MPHIICTLPILFFICMYLISSSSSPPPSSSVTSVGYCMVDGITTVVNRYIDIYCSLVSHTVVLSTAAESCGLIWVCYWSHSSSVDHLMVGVGMLVWDVRQRTVECSSGWKWLDAGLVAASIRSHGCAGYGRPALRRWVPSGMAVWPNIVLMIFTSFDVGTECWMLSAAWPGQLLFVLPLDYLLCCWLAGRACRHGQVNHYQLLVRCQEQRAEVELLCGEAATGCVGVPTPVRPW